MEFMEEPQEGVLRRSIHGGKWYLIGVMAQRLINLVAFFVLTRLLAPKDYGVLAAVFTITNFLDNITTPGIDTALMQRNESPEKYLDTLWTFNLLKSIFIAIGFFFLGGQISSFFKITGSDSIVIKLSGLLVLISALSNIRQFYFFKELNFKKVVIRDFIAQIVYVVVAVGWALFIGASVWALFVGYIARYLAACVASYALYPVRPRLNFNFLIFEDLIGYGKWIYGQNLLDYILGYMDNILVGHLLGAEQLGLYSRARDIPSAFSSPFLGIIDKIGFPAYVKIKDKADKVKEGFLKSIDLFLLITAPVCLLLLLEGGAIVTVVLGAKWLPIVVPLKIFAFSNIIVGLVNLVKPIFNALGLPKINFKIDVLQLIFSPLLLFAGIRFYGLGGAAIAIGLIWSILLVYAIFKARPILKVGKDQIAPIILTIVPASLITFIVALLAHGYIHAHFTAIFIVGWSAMLGIIYLIMVWVFGRLFKRGPWRTAISVWSELRP